MASAHEERVFFEKLYDDYEQKIYYCAYNVLKQVEQAEDVTQDVFEELYHRKEELIQLEELHLKKLILRITKNKAIDAYRRNTTQIKYLDNYRKPVPTNVAITETDQLVENIVAEEKMKELVLKLDEPYLQVFMYRVFYELSTKETAAILVEKEPTIRKQFERAKKKLRAILGGELNEQAK